MANMNISIHLNAYSDNNATNNPSLNNFKWNKDVQGIKILESNSTSVKLPAGESLVLFSGSVSLSSNNTTTYDLESKSGSSNTYVLSHNAGTAPVFRVARTEGHNATTAVTVTKNGPLLKFESTGGTLFDLVTGLVAVGDEVRVGSQFNSLNQGKYKILSFDATSFTVDHDSGVAEGPITLGASFADQINIFGSSGVQIGDKIEIKANFSSVSFGVYEITDVSHDYIEFYSVKSLPEESGVSNNPEAIVIYRDAKSFLYIESDKALDIKINSSSYTNEIQPFKCGVSSKSGIFMSSGSIKSAEIKNKSQEVATVFFASAE